jgi:hypothetical protein
MNAAKDLVKKLAAFLRLYIDVTLFFGSELKTEDVSTGLVIFIKVNLKA